MPKHTDISRNSKGVPLRNLVPKRIVRVARFANLLLKFDPDIYDTFKSVSLNEQELFIQDFESSFGPVKQLRRMGV